jgi:anti-sigma-K factor RskA
VQRQQQCLEELDRRLSGEKVRAERAVQEAADASALVATLQSRVLDLGAELDEARASNAVRPAACTHVQTEANLLEPLIEEVRSDAKRQLLSNRPYESTIGCH